MEPLKRRRLIVLGTAALAVAAIASPRPTASIAIETHEASDLSPHRLKAAVDVGVFALSVLYTWTERSGR